MTVLLLDYNNRPITVLDVEAVYAIPDNEIVLRAIYSNKQRLQCDCKPSKPISFLRKLPSNRFTWVTHRQSEFHSPECEFFHGPRIGKTPHIMRVTLAQNLSQFFRNSPFKLHPVKIDFKAWLTNIGLHLGPKVPFQIGAYQFNHAYQSVVEGKEEMVLLVHFADTIGNGFTINTIKGAEHKIQHDEIFPIIDSKLLHNAVVMTLIASVDEKPPLVLSSYIPVESKQCWVPVTTTSSVNLLEAIRGVTIDRSDATIIWTGEKDMPYKLSLGDKKECNIFSKPVSGDLFFSDNDVPKVKIRKGVKKFIDAL